MLNKENTVNKDKLVIRMQENISEEKRLVGKIIKQIKQARKKARARLNINEKQLRVHLNQIIKVWEKIKIQKIVDLFLAEIKASLQRKENISLRGYFNLEVRPRLNKEKNRIRFRAGSKLMQEINPLSQKKVSYCPKHQFSREEHKTANCCDKSQGIKIYRNCFRFRELQQQIRECQQCDLN